MLVTHDHQPQRRLSVRMKLGGNEALRRAVPIGLTPAVVAARSWIGRQRPGRVETARESMRFVLGAEASDEEVERLADAYLLRATWRIEARWRPALVNAQEIVGLEHLQAARDLGRGVLLSFIHHGDYLGAFPSLARMGQPTTAIGSSGLFDPEGVLWHQQHLRLGTSVPGADLQDVATGSAGIRELFAQQKTVGIALDFPGHTPTRMLGLDLMLSSGGVRIAHGLDVPVVPLLSEPTGTGAVRKGRVVLAEALHPHDHATPESLHAELAKQFEASIRAWPEATEEPLRMVKRHLVHASTEYRTEG